MIFLFRAGSIPDMGRSIPLSRTVATQLVVAVGGRGDTEVTVSAMRALLAILSREAVRVDDVDVYEDHDRDLRYTAYGQTGEVRYLPLWVSTAGLCRDLACEPRSLFGDVSRIRAMAAHLDGPEAGPRLMPVKGNLRRADGLKPKTREASLRIDVEQTLLAAAGGRDIGESPSQAVWIDLGEMARFKCRYSVLAYVRAIAWLQEEDRLPEAWRAHRTAAGALAMDLPAAACRAALGVEGYGRIPDLERRVLDPVAADLATAGISLKWQWVRGRRGTAAALRLRLVPDEAVRPALAPRVRRPRTRVPGAPPRRRRPVKWEPAPGDALPLPVERSGLARVDAAARERRSAEQVERAAARRDRPPRKPPRPAGG